MKLWYTCNKEINLGTLPLLFPISTWFQVQRNFRQDDGIDEIATYRDLIWIQFTFLQSKKWLKSSKFSFTAGDKWSEFSFLFLQKVDFKLINYPRSKTWRTKFSFQWFFFEWRHWVICDIFIFHFSNLFQMIKSNQSSNFHFFYPYWIMNIWICWYFIFYFSSAPIPLSFNLLLASSIQIEFFPQTLLFNIFKYFLNLIHANVKGNWQNYTYQNKNFFNFFQINSELLRTWLTWHDITVHEQVSCTYLHTYHIYEPVVSKTHSFIHSDSIQPNSEKIEKSFLFCSKLNSLRNLKCGIWVPHRTLHDPLKWIQLWTCLRVRITKKREKTGMGTFFWLLRNDKS